MELSNVNSGWNPRTRSAVRKAPAAGMAVAAVALKVARVCVFLVIVKVSQLMRRLTKQLGGA